MNDNARLAEAAVLIRGGPNAPPDPVKGAALFRALADEGDASAILRCAVLAAGGIGQPRDWDRALSLLRQAAAAGEPTANAQLSFFQQSSLEALFTPPAPRMALPDTPIAVVEGFASPEFCRWMIEQGKDKLIPAAVASRDGGRYEVSAARTASTCIFGPLKRDMIVAVMQERAARVSGLPITHHEPPNLIRYEVGELYNAHFDFVPPNQPGAQAELQQLGQRLTTIVTYLNEDFEEGSTHFPRLGYDFRGKTGDAIMFSNVLPDSAPDRRMLHVGRPPTAGRKWVLSQWLRSKPQPVR